MGESLADFFRKKKRRGTALYATIPSEFSLQSLSHRLYRIHAK
ncbi:hypothetical protein LEP1GSC193_3322 [Leptospira alstonii serovar Pingchang str. 80-412]|uniref:Uncharacterized protein n=2 Tax=Leptospira alstonii TaxID=28452 RepID=M6CHD4_9LEPT|nr:hypothetical protein LEP1GSC194_3458 [Leptospira alstonii serovar Sichuan str. 79601]EQA80585.1 hypothetical protein LEP1GSC193_3322 [Leptospira alstonii serovar Pingchang str. 80-412]